MTRTFSIMNLGCKVNMYEAESISCMLEKKGWVRKPFEEKTDASLIFTCAVTNTAASKSRKMMHRVKRNNPDGICVMVGCYAQINDGMLEDAEIVVGTAHKARVPEYLEQYLQDHEKIRDIEPFEETPFENLVTDRFENRTRAYLKVQDGCNQFCAYCVIPYARGRERSMEPDAVIEEAKRITKTHKEIVLTGIHTGRYGREYNVTLTQLIRKLLDEVPALERLRISSIEVTEVSEELIELMKQEKRIARHLHIPLQAGCDATLKRMGRPYSTEAYYDKIKWIREQIPDIAVSCDLIVGFAGEDEEEFNATLQFCEQCEFAFMHVFPFSVRSGTRAEKMPDQVSPQTKKERARIANALSAKCRDIYALEHLGREAEVILEQKEGEYMSGYTSDYIPVLVKTEKEHGAMVNVRLCEYKEHQMYAEESVMI